MENRDTVLDLSAMVRASKEEIASICKDESKLRRRLENVWKYADRYSSTPHTRAEKLQAELAQMTATKYDALARRAEYEALLSVAEANELAEERQKAAGTTIVQGDCPEYVGIPLTDIKRLAKANKKAQARPGEPTLSRDCLIKKVAEALPVSRNEANACQVVEVLEEAQRRGGLEKADLWKCSPLTTEEIAPIWKVLETYCPYRGFKTIPAEWILGTPYAVRISNDGRHVVPD